MTGLLASVLLAVTTQVLAPYDVVVCGGGPSGCAAAIAARRSGLSVLLVEARGRLGGTATSGGVSHWLGGRNDAGEWVVGGLFRGLSERAVKDGAAILPTHPEGKTYQPYAWLPWFIHGVVLDSDRIAFLYDRVMAEEKVDVLFDTTALDVEKRDDRIVSVSLHGKGGFLKVPAKAVIDSTGDADVAAAAGAPFLVGRAEDRLTAPASLTFHLSHVDHAALWAEIERTREPKFRPLIAELRKKGEWPFPYDIFITVKGLADDELMVNTIRLTEVDALDAFSRSRAYARGREEAFRLLDVFRKHFPGFANAQMKSVAPMLGVRESRRLKGDFTLTVEDLRRGTEFPDTIGFSMYGWDLPDPKRPSVQPMVDETGGKFVNKTKKQLVTPIPFRTMVPKGVSNLLVTGRAISVERDVLGPLREMAPCMAMGEAAGVAAQWLVRGESVDVVELRRQLKARGCRVDKADLPTVRPRQDPAKTVSFAGEKSEGVEVPVGTVTNGTVAAWVRFEGTLKGNACPRIFQWGPLYVHTGDSYGFAYGGDLTIGCTGVPKTAATPRGVSNWVPTAPLPKNEWVHFAFAFKCAEATTPVLFLNGKKVKLTGGDKPLPEFLKAAKVVFGNTDVGGNRPFHGAMADLRVFDRVISKKELAELCVRDPDGNPPRDLAPKFNDRLPIVDLSTKATLQTAIAAGTKETYQGHPTTVLADDGTLFCVWTTGHGGPCGPMAKSTDGGRTWTRCDEVMPAEYRTYSNCPTLQRIPRRDGGTNLAVFSNCRGKCGIVISADDGRTWKAAPVADLPAGMPPTGLVGLKDGSAALFGQIRKPNVQGGDAPTSDQAIWMSVSADGGWTWGAPRIVAEADEKNLCEPCVIRSPDGKELALLMRENRHTAASMMCFSTDEGRTWTKPTDTCWGLSGDRHEAAYLPDGRLLVAFRDRALESSTYGQYVGWVGSYADLRHARPGDLRVHLLPHRGEGGFGACDTGYSGVEVLKDGTVVCTTYLKYWADERLHSVVSTRFLASLLSRAVSHF